MIMEGTLASLDDSIKDVLSSLKESAPKLAQALSPADVHRLYEAKCADQQIEPNEFRRTRFMQVVERSCSGLTLSMREAGLGPESMAVLSDVLSANESFAILDFAGNGIGDAGAIALARLLKRNRMVVRLDLRSCNIGPDGAVALGEALQTNCTVTSIDLSGLPGKERNHLGTRGAVALSEAIKVNEVLWQLNLGSNGIGVEGTAALARHGLAYNRTLEDFDLSTNDLGYEGILGFIHGCILPSPFFGIQRLVLSRNGLGDRGVGVLVGALQTVGMMRHGIRHLDISGNDCRGEGLSRVADLMRKERKIVSLVLSDNVFEHSASPRFVEMLRENKTLTHIAMANCSIADESMSLMADALKGSNSLVSLDFSGNFIGSNAATLIFTYARTSQRLQHIDVGKNRIGDEAAPAIAAALAESTSLRSVSLRYNRLKGSGALLAGAMEKNKTLTRIDISLNEMDYKFVVSVNRAAAENARRYRASLQTRLAHRLRGLQKDEKRLFESEEELAQLLRARASTEETLTKKKETLESEKRRQDELTQQEEAELQKLTQSLSETNARLQEISSSLVQAKMEGESRLTMASVKAEAESKKKANAQRTLRGKTKQLEAIVKEHDEILRPLVEELAGLVKARESAERDAKWEHDALVDYLSMHAVTEDEIAGGKP